MLGAGKASLYPVLSITPYHSIAECAMMLLEGACPAIQGEKIRQRRDELGLTQQYLADKLNVTVQAVSQWENGRSQL